MLERDQCGLRPITEADLDQLLLWRNSDRIRANMFTDHLIAPAEHRAWYQRSREQQSSRHLLFHLAGRPAGLVYFTDIDERASRSDWGFYLGETDLPKGAGLALGTLGLEHAFRELDLRKLCGQALGFNEASMRFHQRLGFHEEGRFVRHVFKGGDCHDVVHFALFRDEWETLREELCRNAFPGTVQ